MDQKYVLEEVRWRFFSPRGRQYSTRRIKAVKSFRLITGRLVQAGELGGFVESEANLSQEGSCWIADDAVVCGDAFICDDAVVSEDASVCDSGLVKDDSWVCGGARVYDAATVLHQAHVSGVAIVKGETVVDGNVLWE